MFSLDCKEIKTVNPKGNQPWIFIGRTDAEASILWPPDSKSWLTGKDPDAGKDWGQERGGHRGWDGWMASLTQWTCAWANSRRQWRTGKPGVLQPMGPQRVKYNWATEQQQHSTCWNSVRISRPFQTFIPTWYLYWSFPHVFSQFLFVFTVNIFSAS